MDKNVVNSTKGAIIPLLTFGNTEFGVFSMELVRISGGNIGLKIYGIPESEGTYESLAPLYCKEKDLVKLKTNVLPKLANKLAIRVNLDTHMPSFAVIKESMKELGFIHESDFGPTMIHDLILPSFQEAIKTLEVLHTAIPNITSKGLHVWPLRLTKQITYEEFMKLLKEDDVPKV